MGSKGPASRGQKRAEKTKARQRRQQSSAARPVVVPEDLLEQFTEWLAEQEMAEHAERIVGLVRTTLHQIGRANTDFVVTSWTPNDAHFVVDAAERIEDSDPDHGGAAATNMVVTLLEFLTFLDETDAWTGSDEDFSHCMEDLTDFVNDDPDVLDPADIELPEITYRAESAALSALPIVGGLEALVERVGTGVVVADIPELARALADDHDHDHDAEPVDTVVLDHWAAAFAADVLRSDGTDVTPGPAVDDFASMSVDVLRNLVSQHIRHQLSSMDVDISMGLANTFAVQTLLAAMTDDLPIDNAEEDYEGLEDEDLRTAQLIDYRVRSLQDQGILVQIDDALEVPAPLRRAVLAGVIAAEPFGDEDPLQAL
ncbi:MAG: hypothetical protein WBQ44_01900 [Rhodococcus sp. (in: high G+C Gram-positive bacteria)]